MGGWLLVALLLMVYTLICVFLIFVILIQSGKGGGLSSLGSSSQGLSESLGATGAEKTLNKLTTWCAIGFLVMAILLSLVGGRALGTSGPRPFKDATPSEAAQPITDQPAAPAAPGAAVDVPAAPEAPAAAAPAAPAEAPVAPAPAAPAQ